MSGGRTAAALLSLGLCACAALSPVPQAETATATLDKLPEAVPHREGRAATLLVLPPDARRAYDTAQMAYTVRPYEVAYFRSNQWAATPSQMLQPLLVRTLEATGYFAAVAAAPYAGAHAYALRTEIVEFRQDFTGDAPAFQLSLHLVLSGRNGERPVAMRDIVLREPMREKTPYAGVVAANDAVAKALSEAASFVLQSAD